MGKYFELYEVWSGKLAFTGSANECKEFLNINDVRQIYMVKDRCRNGIYHGYQVVECEYPSEKLDAAIKAWDAFTEPLREKYGIPRYRGATT